MCDAGSVYDGPCSAELFVGELTPRDKMQLETRCVTCMLRADVLICYRFLFALHLLFFFAGVPCAGRANILVRAVQSHRLFSDRC